MITETLTDDELLVLTIAAEGESLAAIGRWEGPIDRLVGRGLMKRGDRFNNRITEAGRRAVEAHEAGEDAAFARAIDAVRGAGPVIEGEAEECPR